MGLFINDALHDVWIIPNVNYPHLLHVKLWRQILDNNISCYSILHKIMTDIQLFLC